MMTYLAGVLNRVVGLLVVLVGAALAGWAPPAFEWLSGSALPAPVPSDQAAMAIWSGVAFVRVFGSVLVGVGAVLWSTNARTPRPNVTQAVLCVSFLFAALIVWMQQVAIWANGVGWALVGLFVILALVAGIRLLHGSQRVTTSAAL